MIRYEVDDRHLLAAVFLPFVNQIWPGDYEETKTQEALQKTLNITAWEGEMLVGCLRILGDGYFFGTITECLVLPSYQNKGIGSKLLSLAKEHTPTSLYFGAQPGVEPFYERNGCQRSLASFWMEKK
jgi:GNAT superfamily N-acetyltransferase